MCSRPFEGRWSDGRLHGVAGVGDRWRVGHRRGHCGHAGRAGGPGHGRRCRPGNESRTWSAMSPTPPPLTSSSREVNARIGGLDVLVNNVGIAGPTAAVDEMDPAAFDHCVRVNLGSMFRCTRSAVPLLRQLPGSIVNISSTAGIFGYPLRSPYVAAKWGVIGLTKTWAMELGPDGIRVNAICPGSVGGSRMDGVIEREAAATGVAAADREVGVRAAGLDGLVRRCHRRGRGCRLPVVTRRPVHLRPGAGRRRAHRNAARQLFTLS